MSPRERGEDADLVGPVLAEHAEDGGTYKEADQFLGIELDVNQPRCCLNYVVSWMGGATIER